MPAVICINSHSIAKFSSWDECPSLNRNCTTRCSIVFFYQITSKVYLITYYFTTSNSLHYSCPRTYNFSLNEFALLGHVTTVTLNQSAMTKWYAMILELWMLGEIFEICLQTITVDGQWSFELWMLGEMFEICLQTITVDGQWSLWIMNARWHVWNLFANKVFKFVSFLFVFCVCV